MLRSAGRRDCRITFERATVTKNSGGQQVESAWAGIAQAWASILFGTGRERRAAAVEQAVNSATFVCNWSPTLAMVTERDRIIWDGQIFDIESVAPMTRKTIEFTASLMKG